MLRGLALIVGVTMVSSCAEDDAPSAGAAPAAEAVSTGPGKTGPILEEGAPPPAVPAVSPHLLYPRGVRVTPNDYSIGPLQDLLSAAEPEHAVTRTLVTFLRALAEGAIQDEGRGA